ncbi:uncharacterized protein [Nicotiana tomentosiformis]|uniref:uncharacterized protein n=1 Tax=Nicotiana tomentosiformis TaxID=4098 RepID=UPI00051C6AB5|nr:uncharacterized protein LOC104095652 [Nicotiana tomentosiformis]
MTIELKHVELGKTIQLTIMYAKCKPTLRSPLWENLRHISTICNTPWCVIRDFNVIASIGEKIGGIPYQMNKSIDFLSMIKNCGLIDLGFYGPRYTWSNRMGTCSIVWKRSDRGLANDNWLSSFPTATITHLASTGSDHSPLLMEMNAQYTRHLKVEEEVLKQKTQLQWFKDGDVNSKYFHSLIRGRRRKLFIHKIKDENGDWILGDEAIGEAAFNYFEDLFTEQGGTLEKICYTVFLL